MSRSSTTRVFQTRDRSTRARAGFCRSRMSAPDSDPTIGFPGGIRAR